MGTGIRRWPTGPASGRTSSSATPTPCRSTGQNCSAGQVPVQVELARDRRNREATVGTTAAPPCATWVSVLTGVYQYTAMALAKTYTAVTKTVAAVPVVAEVVMFFDIAAVGLALAWLVTVWAAAGLSGRRVWDAALVAGSPILIFQAFTNFDALAAAFATAAMLAWARRRPVLAGC